jgi:hypothetical protein
MPTLKRALLAVLSGVITLAGTVYFLDIDPVWKALVLAAAVTGNGLLTFLDVDVPESITITRPSPLTPEDSEEVLTLWMRKRLGRKWSEHYRGTILRWDATRKVLFIWSTVWSGKSVQGEAQLLFTRNQGCVWSAYELGYPVYTDLTVRPHGQWNVDPQSVWPDMKAILCVPLKIRDTVVGVVSIDSDLSLRKSGLSRRAIYQDLGDYSNKAIAPYLR